MNTKLISYLYDVSVLESRCLHLRNSMDTIKGKINSINNSIQNVQNEKFPDQTPKREKPSFFLIWLMSSILLCFLAAAFYLAKESGGNIIGMMFLACIAIAIVCAVLYGICLISAEVGGFIFLFVIIALLYSFHKAILIMIGVAFVASFVIYYLMDQSTEEKYNSSLSAYSSRENDFEKNKRARISTLQQQIVPLNQNLNTINTEFAKTSKLLSDYYSLNILYPKYRNIDAVLKFLEYLQSKRCGGLSRDGGDPGAYNIYEDEWRKDAIIAGLAQINSNILRLSRDLKTLSNHFTGIDSGIRNIDYTIQQQGSAINNLESSNSRIPGNSSSINDLERIQAEQSRRLADYKRFLS